MYVWTGEVYCAVLVLVQKESWWMWDMIRTFSRGMYCVGNEEWMKFVVDYCCAPTQVGPQ